MALEAEGGTGTVVRQDHAWEPARQQGRGTGLDQVCDRIFLVGLLAAVLFVLWLPVFPNGDGPVHLYYANVLWSLVQHQPVYAQDYAVRHLFAPYLVHYLALVCFEHFVSPPMAEKLFIAVIFLTQGFGFRFLARCLGGEASVACLWMLPLLFSWSLGGGFLNCCFATGVALWAFGVWTLLGTVVKSERGVGEVRLGHAAGLLLAFVALLAVLVLSHPVPLLVLLLFTASDLLLRGLASRSWNRGADPGMFHVEHRPRWPSLLPQDAAFLLTCAAFLAPVLLAQKGQAAAVVPGIGFHVDVLWELVSGMRLGLFAGLHMQTLAGWLALAARAGLLSIVPGSALLLLIKARWMQPQWVQTGMIRAEVLRIDKVQAALASPANRLLLISLLFLTATIFFPRSLNHSYFFPQRMWDIVWLLVLACGAAASISSRARMWLAGTALLLISVTAITGMPALARVARAQELLAEAPLPAGKRGLFLEPGSAMDGRGAATTYPVYAWSGVRAFVASRAILLNSPWLGLTILPVQDAKGRHSSAAGVGTSNALLDRGLPSIYSESPLALTNALDTPSPDRDSILARTDFFLYSNPASLGSAQPADQTRRAMLALLGPQSAAWQCEVRGFYGVCVRRAAR